MVLTLTLATSISLLLLHVNLQLVKQVILAARLVLVNDCHRISQLLLLRR